jgi:sulfite reductase (NADPH) flavoprotein alpha-component
MQFSEKANSLKSLLAEISREEQLWVNGYLTALLDQGGSIAVSKNLPVLQSVEEAKIKLTILYATETGNAKSLSNKLLLIAKQRGIVVKAISAEQYPLHQFSKEEFVLVVISTQGDGEAPASAKKLFDFLSESGNERLEGLKFAVVALGDSSYPLFCKAGVEVDELLRKKGASNVFQVIKCDTDYELEAKNGFLQILDNLSQAQSAIQASVSFEPATTISKEWYKGTVLKNINLNDVQSEKETYHIEISSADVPYQPGDSVAIIAHNSVEVVDEIIKLTHQNEQGSVQYRNEVFNIRELLQTKLNIQFLSKHTVKKFGEIFGAVLPETKLSLVDLLSIHPLDSVDDFSKLINILETISPRQYSISSSPNAHPDEIHLIVAKDVFKVNDEERYGLCSSFLSRLSPNTTFEFQVKQNRHFRLPSEEKDIVMIGPGTGIAPFRSFLNERDTTGASGRNWLFFGNPHFSSDFLYQTEIQDWIASGLLHQFNAAFSRDQVEKIYVQHKMLEQSAVLFDWINNGAIIYLCGKKDPMSISVESALLEIIQKEGGFSETKAAIYLNDMVENGQYLKDVY